MCTASRVDELPQFHAGLLKATVRGYTGATPYVRVGNWLVVLMCLGALLAVLLIARRALRPAPVAR